MTSKSALKKICKNLNSYEFTNEFKVAKKRIEEDLEELKSIKSCLADYDLDIIKLREMCMLYLMNKDFVKKQDKAIDIINKKNVNIKKVKYYMTADQYNMEKIDNFAENECLSNEEWNLLKEIFGEGERIVKIMEANIYV